MTVLPKKWGFSRSGGRAILVLAAHLGGCASNSPEGDGAPATDSTAQGGTSSTSAVSVTADASSTTTTSASAGDAGGSTSGASSSSGGLGTGAMAGMGPVGTTSVGGSTSATGQGGSGGASSTGSVGGAGAGGSDGNSGAGGTGGSGDPEGKIVLFDGTSFDAWRPLDGDGDPPWELPGDGTMVVVPESGNIVTRQTFEDVFVHVEYKTPMLDPSVTGQDRGNSGVYLNSMYELQVLDSYGLPPAIDGCGAIYEVSAPSSTACHEQEVWNTYEIEFQVARFDSQGSKTANARVVSAYLNGVLVQEDVEVPASTKSGQPEVPGPGPLMLQDHLNPVAFRNIWVVPR